MHIEVPEQLNCPICMAILKIPITTQCGHTFCRSCLINSLKTKKVCPMCRQQFQNSAQKLKQDQVVSLILQDYRIKSKHLLLSEKTCYQSKSEKMLLLDVKTTCLLLPYNKHPVSFQLQNPTILNKLQTFVARQQSPYNKYGIISRIVSLNKLRYNVYECILEGKAFCLIQDDKIEQEMSQMDEEYFYRTCKAKQIIQTTNLNTKEFQPFFQLFNHFKENSILQKVYRQIDYKVFLHANDPLALMYSIFGILSIDDQQKYNILTTFDEENRISTIKQFVKKLNNNQNVNITAFLNVDKGKKINYAFIFVVALLILLIFLVNSDEEF